MKKMIKVENIKLNLNTGKSIHSFYIFKKRNIIKNNKL